FVILTPVTSYFQPPQAAKTPFFNFSTDEKTKSMMRLLDAVIRSRPIGLVMMKKLEHILRQSLTQIEKKTPTNITAFIKEQQQEILKPVEEIFDIISTNGSILKSFAENIQNFLELKRSILLEFLNSGETLHSFYEKNITSLDNYKQLCKEVATFIKSIHESISP